MELRTSSNTQCTGTTSSLVRTARRLCAFQTPRASSLPDVVVKRVKRGACAYGWEASQRGMYVGIAIAGNAGRFGGACGEYISVPSAVEREREAMTAAARFQANRYTLTKLHSHHTTQEESVIANMETTADHLGMKERSLLSNGRLKVKWGLVHPKRAIGKRHSTMTFQGIDYTVRGQRIQKI